MKKIISSWEVICCHCFLFRLRQKASIGFRSLHYLFSLSSKWHDAWSDFSRLDHVFVLLLDQLAGIAAVSVSFAFGKDKV